MTFKAKLVAYGVAGLALTAFVDVFTVFGPMVLMCTFAGIVAAWAIETDSDAPRRKVSLKKAA